MCMRPLLELFGPRMRRKGSTSQPKCLCVEESVLRKTKGKDMKKCVVEAFIAMCNTLNLANVYMCLCMYTMHEYNKIQ